MDAEKGKQDWSDNEMYESLWTDEEMGVMTGSHGEQTVSKDTHNEENQQPESTEPLVAVHVGVVEDQPNLPADDKMTTTHDANACSSESDENVPLADMKRSIKAHNRTRNTRKRVKRKLIVEDAVLDNESDDSVQDSTYMPSEKDINTSDSGSNNEQYKRRKHDARDKTWKKTTTRIRKQKAKKSMDKGESVNRKLRMKIKNMESARKRKPVKTMHAVERAKQKSLKLHSIKLIIQRYHTNRLDQLLLANELKRISVPSDGNCFFAALCISANIDKTIVQMRADLCNHLSENVDRYAPFCYTNTSNSDQQDEFKQQVEDLKLNGNWMVDSADCLPLAVADLYNCTVRIYSSSITKPLYVIKPSTGTDSGKIINLAYIAIRDEEHYDAVTTLSKNYPATTQGTIMSHSIETERHGGILEADPNTVADPVLKHTDVIDTSMTQSDESGRNGDTGESRTDTENIHVDNIQSDVNADMPQLNVTPHKRTIYKSPTKRVSSRKKKRNPQDWKRNKHKTKRCSGQPYVSSKSGKLVTEKSVKPHNCDKCRFKCKAKVPEETRHEIFKFYYGLGSYDRQRAYICEMIDVEIPKRAELGKTTKSLKYHLSVCNTKERVCRDFFMKTLDISRKAIDYTIKRKVHGSFGGTYMRGKQPPANRISKERADFIHEHIKSFPRMESHYVRKKSTEQYLAHDLGIKQMWRLYSHECERKSMTPVKESKYRQIFCENYNLSFFKPKKDQCALCTPYNRKKNEGSMDNKKKRNTIAIRKIKLKQDKKKGETKGMQKKIRIYTWQHSTCKPF